MFSGVMDNATACGDKLDHGVLVVGMTDDAWIVKNSWGPVCTCRPGSG
jgi:hypothetical protein